MGKIKEEDDWVKMTQDQIVKEGSSVINSSVSGQHIHPPLEPVPDNDWVGGTWGLFWPDLEEFDQLKEDPEKFLKKHYEDRNTTARPPADQTAQISILAILDCPKQKTPPPAPTTVVLRKKKPEPPTVYDSCDVDNDNSKWSWMRSGDKSAGRARFSLSIYW